MSGDIVEEYFQLCNRDKLDDLISRYPNGFFEPLPEELRAQIEAMTPEREKLIREERYRRHLVRFDATILSEAGLSLDRFIKLVIDDKSRRRAGGRLSQKKEVVRKRAVALQAIKLADDQNLSWEETIERAQSACLEAGFNTEFDRKTIGSWLRALKEFGEIGIVMPVAKGRGRPRKKK